MLKIKTCLAFKLSDVVFIMLINAKMLTIVGIVTIMSMINELSMRKTLIISGPGVLTYEKSVRGISNGNRHNEPPAAKRSMLSAISKQMTKQPQTPFSQS